jgi:hypothetical protein
MFQYFLNEARRNTFKNVKFVPIGERFQALQPFYGPSLLGHSSVALATLLNLFITMYSSPFLISFRIVYVAVVSKFKTVCDLAVFISFSSRPKSCRLSVCDSLTSSFSKLCLIFWTLLFEL